MLFSASAADRPESGLANFMLVSKQPIENGLGVVAGKRRCPSCDGPLVEIHCIARCMRCHSMIDTCCEGVAPNPSKLGRLDAPRADRSLASERGTGTFCSADSAK